jgi:hypothetical protein
MGVEKPHISVASEGTEKERQFGSSCLTNGQQDLSL